MKSIFCSVRKQPVSLDLEKAIDFSGILESVSANKSVIPQYFSRRMQDPDCFARYRDIFSFDGSLIIPLSHFAPNKGTFFDNPERYTLFRQRAYLRGSNYTISANPTYELREKLEILERDFNDGASRLPSYLPNFDIYLIGLLDYLKNISITLLNALIYEEKIGFFRTGDPVYQSLRKKSINLSSECSHAFYSALCGLKAPLPKRFDNISKSTAIIHSLARWITTSYEKRQFSSRYLVRPEAAHPINVLASALLSIGIRGNKPDIIVGLPAGGSELAFAHRAAMREIKKRDVPVFLVPVSLHSAKEHFDGKSLDKVSLGRYLRDNRSQFLGKNVLVVDDNSSTGQTLQLLCDSLLSECKPTKLDFVVAEADITRTSIDLPKNDRTHVASRELYSYSIGILPVSRTLQPKVDLKEIIERRRMLKDINRQYPLGISVATDVVRASERSLVLKRTEEVMRSELADDAIFKFKGTFLSNFWPCDIKFGGRNFNSIEHAYQAAKFEADTLGKLTDFQMDRINKRLEKRGEKFDKDGLIELFDNPQISAGSTKIVANEMRIMGLVRDDWDKVKFFTMAELLLLKFSIPELRAKLVETRSRYLIEGNDWGDTLWGVVDGRGKNLLGRMIMVIRDDVVLPDLGFPSNH